MSSKIPEKGWFICKDPDDPANLSQVYLDGKRLPRVSKAEVVIDAEKPFAVLRLEIVAPQMVVDFVQGDICSRPVEVPWSGRKMGADEAAALMRVAVAEDEVDLYEQEHSQPQCERGASASSDAEEAARIMAGACEAEE